MSVVAPKYEAALTGSVSAVRDAFRLKRKRVEVGEEDHSSVSPEKRLKGPHDDVDVQADGSLAASGVVVTENSGRQESALGSSPHVGACTQTDAEGSPSPTMLDLAGFENAEELEALGLSALKQQLALRGMKIGGTLKERAARLYLAKSGTIPPSALVTK